MRHLKIIFGLVTTFLLLVGCTLSNPNRMYLYDTSKKYSGNLKGHVQDPFGESLGGINVVLKSEKNLIIHGTTTDLEGNFEMHELPPVRNCTLVIEGRTFTMLEMHNITIIEGFSGNYCVTMVWDQRVAL